MPNVYAEKRMMRIGLRRISGSTQAAVILSMCLAVMAMTSGLLLAIHLDHSTHGADHDSQNCSLCRHLLILSKKLMLHSGDDLLTDAHICRASQPLPALPAQNHPHRTSRSRAPPYRS